MLEKPDLNEEDLLLSLRRTFGLNAAQIEFLPLGVDVNTAVYRAVTAGGETCFVKLRGGIFEETSVTLPLWLHEQGIRQIIAPIAARDGRLWAEFGAYKVILYPFVSGQDGYAAALSAGQWGEFGAALKRIHTADLPPDLSGRIPRETYTPRYRQMVRGWMARFEREAFADPLAQAAAGFLRKQAGRVAELLARAEDGARILLAQPRSLALCHTDLHAGNLLIAEGGDFYIVDWDQPLLAPCERDLMFIGGGQGFAGVTPAQECEWFYRGYDSARVDPAALAYYRCERIVQDIAAFCEQIFDSNGGGEDRAQGYRYLVSNFKAGGTIDLAFGFDSA